MKMKYRKINDYEIEIIPKDEPIQHILEVMARVSYESARPVGMGFLQPFTTKSEDMDFSKFVNLNSRFDVLDMDYVNGRQCKTFVRKSEDGKYLFRVDLYERDRGSPELFLDKVKSELEDIIKDSKTKSKKIKKPVYWDRVEMAASRYGIKIDSNNPRESRLKVALALDKDNREMEAVEIMMGRDFDPKGCMAFLLVAYKMGNDPPEKFYKGFADIDALNR